MSKSQVYMKIGPIEITLDMLVAATGTTRANCSKMARDILGWQKHWTDLWGRMKEMSDETRQRMIEGERQRAIEKFNWILNDYRLHKAGHKRSIPTRLMYVPYNKGKKK